MTADPYRILGHHTRECPTRFWRVTTGWESRDEYGRRIKPVAGEEMRDEWRRSFPWHIIKCRGCGREGLVRSSYLAELLYEDARPPNRRGM